MIYELESDNSALRGKKFSSPNFSFRVGEEFEHNGHKYIITYITHVFGASGHYTKTKVGLDR